MRWGAGGAVLLLAAAALAGCSSGSTEPVPGIAHPAASADNGFRIADEALLHDFNGIDLVLPPGWHAQIADDCISPPGTATRTPRECPERSMRIRPDASAGEPGDRRDDYLDAPEEIDDRTGDRRPRALCTTAPGLGPRSGRVETEPEKDPTVTSRGAFVLVSGERVEWAEWTVDCPDGSGYRTRTWYAPSADVAFDVPRIAEGEVKGYTEVVRSVDLSRYR